MILIGLVGLIYWFQVNVWHYKVSHQNYMIAAKLASHDTRTCRYTFTLEIITKACGKTISFSAFTCILELVLMYKQIVDDLINVS